MQMLLDSWNSTTDSTNPQQLARPVYFHSVEEPFRSVLPAAFDQAAQRAGEVIERTFRLGGQVLRLRFAGSGLVSVLTPALEHRAAAGDLSADMTINLWDSATTGTPPLPLPRIPEQAIAGTTRSAAPILSGEAVDVVRAQDDVQHGYCWMRDAAAVPYYERAAPLRQQLQWWLRRHGRQLLHAAAVGRAGRAVLVPGNGGAGKSTTALACLEAGLGYLGDDFTLAADQPAPVVYTLFSTAKVHADNLHRVAFVRPLLRNAERLDVEKAVAFLQPHHARQLLDAVPLSAILLPRITGGLKTRLRPAAPVAALTVLTPSTLAHLAGGRDQGFATMASLVRQTSCYWLELGTDLAQVARTISDFLG